MMIKYINKYAIQQLGVTKTGTGISLPIHEKKLKYVLPNDRAHRWKSLANRIYVLQLLP